MEELFEFAKIEHERLVNHYNLKDNSKTKYTILAKLMEELGELSEAILMYDSLQRSDKLEDNKTALEEELADVILTTLILSKELDVNIQKALKAKIEKISKRKY